MHLHKNGELPAAALAYRAALEGDGRSVGALMNLAALESQRGHARIARALFDEASRLSPNDARVARDVGIGLAAIGELATARESLERATALDPGLVGAALHASRVCAELGDSGAALEHAQRAIAKAPEDASSQLELYRASFDDRALESAIAAAERAVELAPRHAGARYFRGAAVAFARGNHAALADPAIPSQLAAAARYALAPRDPKPRIFATRFETLRFACQNAMLEAPAVELGVRFGVSTRVIAALVEHLHAFDSFEGLPEEWQGKPAGTFSTGGEPPELPANVTVHRGWFDQTLPSFAREHSAPLRLLHVDSDLYSSAAFGLETLGPRVVAGTVLVFDQYIGNESWLEDEHRAFQEAAMHFGWRYQYLAFSWITGQAVLRIE